MSVKRSVEQVYATILDIEKYPSWVPYCADASVLERSDSTIYFYQLLDMPLVKNRDIIIKAEIMELDNGLQVTMVAAPDKIKKDPDAIRITDFSAVYSITSKDSHSTLVELTNRVDPGGYIPNFAINWASRSQPYETFSNLKREITG